MFPIVPKIQDEEEKKKCHLQQLLPILWHVHHLRSFIKQGTELTFRKVKGGGG